MEGQVTVRGTRAFNGSSISFYLYSVDKVTSIPSVEKKLSSVTIIVTNDSKYNVMYAITVFSSCVAGKGVTNRERPIIETVLGTLLLSFTPWSYLLLESGYYWRCSNNNRVQIPTFLINK